MLASLEFFGRDVDGHLVEKAREPLHEPRAGRREARVLVA